ncbi:MAG: hypothetical protein OXP28_12570 [Gammaproteobacteria bacterium]|nr:hypothetical protein [Gammaproteobacteria bacterium]MDE0225954.1 hypothetical protein [Gammaproteobacteria bacterium]
MNGTDRDRRARLAVTLLAWLWAGLVLGVSFVATPVKFLAPSLSLADALAVGRVTFEALKWIECVAVVALAATVWITTPRRRELALLGVIVLILLCQYAWMLPILDARVQTIIDGQDLPPSSLHWIYTVLEFLKVVVLVAIGQTGCRTRSAASGS